jgi:4-hydroxybenzoate polyprenyltransferase
MITEQPESIGWTIIRLLRWDKPAGRLILMIPALWAVVLSSQGQPPLPLVGVIILGTLATSALGCVVNDLWDRDIDPQVERTKKRPLAEKSLSIKTAIAVAFISLSCAGILALYLNLLTFWLCVAAVPVIICYPLAKRFFPIPQLVLSIAWGFAVLISWTAVTENLQLATWILWGAVILWTLGFDTVYAMSDRQDDLKIGINSSALFFGKYAPDAVGICFIFTAILLGYLGLNLRLHQGFWLSLIMALGLWLWEYFRLKQTEIPHPTYALIFRENVTIGFILLGGMISGYLL